MLSVFYYEYPPFEYYLKDIYNYSPWLVGLLFSLAVSLYDFIRYCLMNVY